MALSPEVLKHFAGPMGNLRYAMQKNPGAVTPELIQAVATHLNTGSSEPFSPSVTTVDKDSAGNPLPKPVRFAGTGPRQSQVLADPEAGAPLADYRKQSMTLRERQMKLNALNRQYTALMAVPIEANREPAAKVKAQIDALLADEGGAPAEGAAPEAAATFGDAFVQGLEDWKKKNPKK